MPEPLIHSANDTAKDERWRNQRAMVVLDESEVPCGVREAIQNLCASFRLSLLSSIHTQDNEYTDYLRKVAQFLQYEHLIAAQPNLHSGRALLPVHLDDPRKDGFGLIILTICMEGAGTILLRDFKGVKRGFAMKLGAGEAYMLSGNARDACAHGVLADEEGAPSDENDHVRGVERESLNLRFGLHDVMAPSTQCGDSHGIAVPLPIIPSETVFRHWKE